VNINQISELLTELSNSSIYITQVEIIMLLFLLVVILSYINIFLVPFVYLVYHLLKQRLSLKNWFILH